MRISRIQNNSRTNINYPCFSICYKYCKNGTKMVQRASHEESASMRQTWTAPFGDYCKSYKGVKHGAEFIEISRGKWRGQNEGA